MGATTRDVSVMRQCVNIVSKVTYHAKQHENIVSIYTIYVNNCNLDKQEFQKNRLGINKRVPRLCRRGYSNVVNLTCPALTTVFNQLFSVVPTPTIDNRTCFN